MKKNFYLLLLLVALPLQAQKWSVAPKIGLNLSDMTGEFFEGGMKVGLNAGLSTEYRFSNVFAIEPGIFYSMQGIKDGDIVRKNDYINVPLLAKAYTKSGLNVFAGPQLGLNVSEKIVITDNNNRVTTLKTDDIMPLDLSVMIGVGYQFKRGFLLSANYNIGITNVADNYGDEPSRNGVFQFNAGWRFKL